MFRALAEFVMRGRLQAGAVAVFGYIVPLLTPVTVALVTLRKGAFEGTVVLLLGLMPALLSLVLGEGSSIFVWVTLLSLVVIYVPAVVLRLTVSLPKAVISTLVVSAIVTGLVQLFSPEVVENMIAAWNQRLAEMQQQNPSLDVAEISALGILGLITYVLGINALVALIVGRWLQALAFNPGGFGSEFREFRLDIILSLVCFCGSVFLRYQGDEFWWWSNVLAIPLLLVACAIAHSIAKAKALALPWMILFYMMAFILTPIVMCIGFVDNWFDFRQRLNHKA